MVGNGELAVTQQQQQSTPKVELGNGNIDVESLKLQALAIDKSPRVGLTMNGDEVPLKAVGLNLECEEN